MYCKEMTYEDFEGNMRTEKFYFNLTEAELIQMETSVEGGYNARVQAMVDADNRNQLIKIVKDFLDLSYGEKSPDGKYFTKNATITERFQSTQAYSDMYMLLATDDNEAQKFINGIVPKNFAKRVEDLKEKAAIKMAREAGVIEANA